MFLEKNSIGVTGMSVCARNMKIKYIYIYVACIKQKIHKLHGGRYKICILP
jgi:hypothetical protein